MGPPQTSQTPLSWALAVATYERRDDLVRCVTLALGQDRPPAEVVVVDASRDFAGNRAAVEAAVGGRVPLTYEPARRASASVQRNQCVALASADVLFLIDDDTLLYPGSAGRVMAVYDADPESRVAGVALQLAPRPPTETEAEPAGAEDDGADGDDGDDGDAGVLVTSYGRRHGRLGRAARRLLRADDLFVPYDAHFPRHDVPPAVHRMAVGHRTLMAGMTMTARRPALLAEPFDEDLLDRGGEDSDVSYRLGRHGALLTALEARAHHVGSPGGRVADLTRERLYAVAPLMMHRKHSTDLRRSARRSRSLLRRKVALGLAKDLRFGAWTLPHARGALAGLRAVGPILGGDDPAAALAWFDAYQRRVLGRS